MLQTMRLSKRYWSELSAFNHSLSTHKCSLLQKLTHDIRIILSPSYEDLVSRLVVFLPKPISAEALTALLASFSSLFNHVLNSTEEPGLIQRTWHHFRDILPKCNTEVRRATAEVWGTSLRKFKLLAREVLVKLLLNDFNLIEDMCAWIFVVSCKVCSF
jgi:U3 small nucleolar RNA-associated protein 20